MPRFKKTAKLKRIKIKYLLIFAALVVLLFSSYKLMPTYMRYYFEVTARATGYAKETRSDSYTIIFHSNGGTGTMLDQPIKYGVPTHLNTNAFTREDYTFTGWNTSADGSGTDYTDGEEINNTTLATIYLYAQWGQGTAIIVGDPTPYQTLQAAINAVPNGTQKTVKLLKSVSETITVSSNKNIILNLQNNTLSNNGANKVITNSGTIILTNGTIRTNATGTNTLTVAVSNNSGATFRIEGGQIVVTSNTNAIINKGLLEMTGGKITSSASSNGAVNVETGGTARISGGEIEMTGGRQALYNDGGRSEISGSAVLTTESAERAAVQNAKATGTLIITGGTIISKNTNGNKGAVNNAGIMTIGIKNDGTVSRTSPVIQGKDYGIASTTSYNFYDGIVKGITAAFSDRTKIGETEAGYDIVDSEENINNFTYKTAYLAIAKTVTFNANGGTITSEPTRKVEAGTQVGTLPFPDNRPGHVFLGWYTDPDEDEGEEVTSSYIVNDDVIFYAHWLETTVAQINGVPYVSIQAAINAVPTTNTETTITVLVTTQESVTVAANKNVVFDLQNHTITNDGDKAVITNEGGTVKIINGTLTGNGASNATINNGNKGSAKGKLIVTGGNVISTGTRSAIYNTGGIVEISGTAYIESTASGTPNNQTMERGTIHNLTGGNVTITGGTIVGLNQQAISNQGTVTIGTKDGNISTVTPVIIGKTCGIHTETTFNYYDGIIKGINTPVINGTITDKEVDTQIANGTETIGNDTYNTNWLELIP